MEQPAAPLRWPGSIPARVPVYLTCTLLAIACNFFLGKDMAWDTLNYHLYAGFSSINDRFSQDYFAAGPPSYFNPYIYAPFYELIKTGLPALAIGSLLAALHAAALWLTFELGVLVCPSTDPRARLTTGICAALLAFMNPILMQEIGSCFADITTAELVLVGWVLLIGAVRSPRQSRIVCAGLLLGLASGLKLSNGMHAVAAGTIILMLHATLWKRIRLCFTYGVSVALGFAAISAPWSYRLERMFGNPFFPIFNTLFRSPEYTTEPQQHFRFVPDSFMEALWRPFAMADPVRMVHEELRAPDLRYAVLALLIAIFVLCSLWGRLPQSHSPASPFTKPAPLQREFNALTFAFLVDWALWLKTSGNSRYFLPMACVAGVVIVGLVLSLFAKRGKTRNYLLAAIFSTQAIQLAIGAEYRWNGVPWGGQWFDVVMPDKLRTEPNLFLTIGSQSNSFLAPFLAPASGLINFSGGYELSADGATGARVRALIAKNLPHVRVLLRGKKLYEDGERRPPRRSQVDYLLGRFGLRTDMSDCQVISVRGLPPDLEIQVTTSEPPRSQSHDSTDIITCHVITDNSDQSEQLARKRAVDLVFNRVEDACPSLFQPRGAPTLRDRSSWQRLYTNTDIVVRIINGNVKFFDPVRGGDPPVFIGSETDWTQQALSLDCGRSNGTYFAKIVRPAAKP